MRKFIAAYQLIAVLLLNALVLFLAVNLVLGLYYAFRDGQRAAEAVGSLQYGDERLSIVYPEWDAQARDALLRETWSRPLVCAPFLHFRERPYQGAYVNVQEAGFRQGLGPQPWPPSQDALTIFVFGGSTTFGYGLPDWQTIPALMQSLLDERIGVGQAQIYNFGQGFYFSSQELRLYEQLLQSGVRPDGVVFIDGVNDMSMGGEPYNWRGLDCDSEASSAVFEWPIIRFARGIRPEAAPPHNAEDSAQRLQARAAESIAIYRANRQMIRAIADSYETWAVFVWQPHPNFLYDARYHLFARGAAEHVGYRLFHEMRSEWSGWDDFLYLAELQVGREEPLYVDNIHYTRAFSEEIAQAVVAFLFERGFIKG